MSSPEIRAIIFHIILCYKGGHHSVFADGRRKFLIFYLRRYNEETKKALHLKSVLSTV